jgi:hypothetical protein
VLTNCPAHIEISQNTKKELNKQRALTNYYMQREGKLRILMES